MSVAPLSLANIQGDIVFGLPKQSQSFFLFTIDQPDAFRSNLGQLVPLITSADQTKSNITEIKKTKQRLNMAVNEGDGEAVHPAVVTVSGVNIAFSAAGLKKMGIVDDLLDNKFAGGMKADAQNLGDNGAIQSDGSFNPNWDDSFLKEIHGVALVTGDSRDTMNSKLSDVKNILKDSVGNVATLVGDVRPGDEAGHEHFGYLDGISEPALSGIESVKPGQKAVDQGIILLGRGKDASSNRPSWALDGSFMALRKLPQLVPEFDKFLVDSAGSQEAADLMGARLNGRWKSGAPLELSPTKDDPALGADPQRNNNFTFTANNQSKCPFAAHIRKMNPRGDISDSAIETARIIRRGIPFGPEVTQEEKDSHTTKQERGLFFVCYQTHIERGFSFLQQFWANNANFPPVSGKDQPGFDPLIGQTIDASDRVMTGAFASNTSQPLNLVAQWVNSKGGEYFFTPSIPTLKNVFAKKAKL